MSEQGGGITSTEYLDKHGVTTYLKDVVTLLLENRPEDPMEFMADYFRNVVNGTSTIVRSFRYIKLTSRMRESFFDNLVAAYTSLNNTTKQDDDGNAQAAGSFTFSELRELVLLVCQDFPKSILDYVEDCLFLGQKPPLESDMEPEGEENNDLASRFVSFTEFATAINACLLYEEFLKEAKNIFLQIYWNENKKNFRIEKKKKNEEESEEEKEKQQQIAIEQFGQDTKTVSFEGFKKALVDFAKQKGKQENYPSLQNLSDCLKSLIDKKKNKPQAISFEEFFQFMLTSFVPNPLKKKTSVQLSLSKNMDKK